MDNGQENNEFGGPTRVDLNVNDIRRQAGLPEIPVVHREKPFDPNNKTLDERPIVADSAPDANAPTEALPIINKTDLVDSNATSVSKPTLWQRITGKKS